MKYRTGEIQLDYMNKAFFYDAGSFEFEPGDVIVVETDYGLDMGLLVNNIDEREVPEDQLPLKKMVRLATDDDLSKQEEMIPKEESAYEVCNDEIEKAGLGMKLVNARYSFDGSRVSFCYTAESRVDFRELVKSLASRLRTRIELRQVGVRDEARLFGGFGPCGRQLCCSSFLRDFKSVSIKMAKEQGLPLNPLKISGICGRLFCCLKYEYEYYLALKDMMPRVGEDIQRGEVKGSIASVNVLKQTVSVRTEGGGWAELDIDIPEEKLLERLKNLECSCGRHDDDRNQCGRHKGKHKGKKHNSRNNRQDKKEADSRESESGSKNESATGGEKSPSKEEEAPESGSGGQQAGPDDSAGGEGAQAGQEHSTATTPDDAQDSAPREKSE